MTSGAARTGWGRDVGVLLILAAGFRLVYWIAVGRVLESPDGVLYLRTAEALRALDWSAANPKLPPLYPALVAIASGPAPDAEMAARLVSFLFSVLLIVPVYGVSRDLHGSSVARMSGLLIAAWPWLVDYGSRVATEPVAVFLFVSGVWCLVRATGLESMGGRGWVAGAAMAFSGLHLARPEGMFVLLAAAIAGAVLFYRRDGRLRRFAVTFGAVAAVGIAVNTAYVQVVADVWTVNYRVGFIGEQPEGSTVLRELARTLRGMAVDVPAVMLGPLLWLFVGIGLVQAGRDVRHVRAEVTVLFFAAVQWLVVLPVLSPSPRYLMSALVLVMLWCGRGISETGRLLGAHVRVRGGRWAPAAAALLFFAGHLAFAIAGQRFGEGSLRPPREYKVAGQWMGEHLEHGTILTRKPQVAYYAGMPSIGPALDASLEEIVAMGEAGVYRYLVVDERYSARMAPSLHGLLDPETAPETLRLIRDDLSPYPDARVVVYEVAVR